MTTLVDRYFGVLERIGVDDFEHPDLEAIRRQMSDEDLRRVHTRLVEEGEAAMTEAGQLEKFGQRKFGANDNSSRLMLALLAALVSPAWADSGILPDSALTPGAARTTNIGEVCSTSTRELRHWARERDDHIMAEYGLPGGPHPQYEVDHLIPLCLGGADSDANLWPEPRRSIEPIWNAERKDELEARMCSLVCSGQLDVAAAQRAIADDWTLAYQQYFRPPGNFFPPVAGAMTPR